MNLIKRKRRAKKALKNNNIRRSIIRYTESPKRKIDAKELTIEQQDKKFDKIFPNAKEVL
tara:strand:- start:549 stop:728 length:180 start_codon:yes stop_codon:yes gene_type:complete